MLIFVILFILTFLSFVFASNVIDCELAGGIASFGVITGIIAIFVLALITTVRAPSLIEANRIQLEEQYHSICRQASFINEVVKDEKTTIKLISEYGELSREIRDYNSNIRIKKAKRDSIWLRDFVFSFYDEVEPIELNEYGLPIIEGEK